MSSFNLSFSTYQLKAVVDELRNLITIYYTDKYGTNKCGVISYSGLNLEDIIELLKVIQFDTNKEQEYQFDSDCDTTEFDIY